MKRKRLVASLALALSIGIGATVYAAAAPANSTSTAPVYSNNGTWQRLGLGRFTGMRGYDDVHSALLKLGVTEKDISDGIASGKTLYEIAEAKGISADKLKAAITEEKYKTVDEAVLAGKISKDQGDTLKENIKTNSDNCTTPGQMRGMGRGRSNGNCIGMGYNRVIH